MWWRPQTSTALAALVGAAVGPVFSVVDVAPGGWPVAAGRRAALVAGSTARLVAGGAGGAADVERLGGGAEDDGDAFGVAGEPAGRRARVAEIGAPWPSSPGGAPGSCRKVWYIAAFPPAAQAVLHDLRNTFSAATPGAGETISYQMPTLMLRDKPVLHFAGWKSHVSVYPIPVGDGEFERQVAPYRSSKGTLKFPLSMPLPLELIRRAAELLAQHGSAQP